MARVTKDGLSGVVGNVIFYTSNGVNYARSKPATRKKVRGKPANPLNKIFGIVSKYGSGMIKGMSSSFLFPFGRGTYNVLRGWIRNQYAAHYQDATWELAAKNNVICQVNAATDLRDYLTSGVSVADNGGGQVEIGIPAMNPAKELKAPAGTVKVNLKMIVVTAPFRESRNPGNFCMEQYKFNYSTRMVPAKKILLDTNSAAGDIAMVAIALEFETALPGTTYNLAERWLPAAVVAIGKLKK